MCSLSFKGFTKTMNGGPKSTKCFVSVLPHYRSRCLCRKFLSVLLSIIAALVGEGGGVENGAVILRAGYTLGSGGKC